MAFPFKKFINNNKIILKSNSIIFFEIKISFPQYKWKDTYKHFFKKFLAIFKQRGIYNSEYLQMFLYIIIFLKYIILKK